MPPMTKKNEELNEEDVDSGDDLDGLDFTPCFVSQKGLEELKTKLEKDESPTEKELADLVNVDALPDDAMVVAVDFKEIAVLQEKAEVPDEEFEDEMALIGAIVKKAGAKETATAFVKAHQSFQKEAAEHPEDEMDKPMTCAEMKELMANCDVDDSDDDDDDDDDELDDDDEDDDDEDDDDEDDDDEDDEGGDEDEEGKEEGPPTKKAKTA